MSLTETLHLLRAVRLGDRAALDALYARHSGRLLGFIRSRMTPELARHVQPEDILQETLLESARKIDGFEPRGPSSFYAWLVEIARYKMAEARRAGRADKRAKQAPLEGATQALGISTTPSRHAVASEGAERLAAALERITPERAEAVRLRYLEGLSVAEAAGRLGCSETALKSRVARGLAELSDHV